MRIKKYLSYSQFNTFLSSPKRYKKMYIDGIRLSSKYLSFGSKIATALETREKSDDPDIIKALELIPDVQEKEKEFLVDFEGIPLSGKLDGFEFIDGVYHIEEDKTGKNPWTQSKVDNAKQITFYVIFLWKTYGVKPEDIKVKLRWLETFEDVDGSIHLTGRVEVFETQRTMKDILNIYPDIKKAWLGIEELVNSCAK